MSELFKELPCDIEGGCVTANLVDAIAALDEIGFTPEQHRRVCLISRVKVNERLQTSGMQLHEFIDGEGAECPTAVWSQIEEYDEYHSNGQTT